MVTIGAVWALAGFAVTMFLPVRSSLYACFPSVGVALAGAAIASALWRAGSAEQRRVAAAVALILPVLLIPDLSAEKRQVGRARRALERT